MFGELLGVWAAAVWQAMGEPATWSSPSLGRGAARCWPTRFACSARARNARRLSIALVETSPVLRETQSETLRGSPAPLQWCESIEDVPQGPLIVIANEFIDALPVRQLVRAGERLARALRRAQPTQAASPSARERRSCRTRFRTSLRAMRCSRRRHRRDAPRGLVPCSLDTRRAGQARAGRRAVRRLRPRRERHRRYAASRAPPSLRRPARRCRARPTSPLMSISPR